MHDFIKMALASLLFALPTQGHCQMSVSRLSALPQYTVMPPHGAAPAYPPPLVTALPFGAGMTNTMVNRNRVVVVAPNAADAASGIAPGMPGFPVQTQSAFFNNFSRPVFFRGR